MSDFVLVEDVPEETVRLMLLLGHARLAEDGVYELTATGSAWLRDWCQRRLAEAGAA